MASQDNNDNTTPEDLEEEDDDDVVMVMDEEDDDDDDEEDDSDDDDAPDDSISSSLPSRRHPLLPPPPPPPPLPVSSPAFVSATPIPSSSSSSPQVTVAIPPLPSSDPILKGFPDDVSASAIASSVASQERKPLPLPLDESRKLFQRLWTDEDEIELLRGFIDYTAQRGTHSNASSSSHHDTTAFYDQIKSKLQLDFNKNQLVEKLRRLKKKYRNIINKMASGKEYVFKSPHEKITFELSQKIWGGTGAAVRGSGSASVVVDVGGAFDDDDQNPGLNLYDHSPNPNGMDLKTPRSRKRLRPGVGVVNVKVEEKPKAASGFFTPTAVPVVGSVSGVIEETVKNCLSPIFKELLNSMMSLHNGPYGIRGGFGVSGGFGPMSLGFGQLNGGTDGAMDEKWRKQQILELEVYSKRLELVQDQIKAQLEELRSMGS